MKNNFRRGFMSSKLFAALQLSLKSGYGFINMTRSYGRNIAVVLQETNRAEVRETPVPEVKGIEVLVKMAFVQLGRTDLHVSTTGKLRGQDVLGPHNKATVLGSLGTGTVLSIGSDVLGDLDPGDRVVLEPRIHCGSCPACQERMYHMCHDLRHPGIPPVNGMLQTYYSHPWHLCHRLPSEVGLREGSYCTTLAYCLNAYKWSEAGPKSNVVVIGAGMAGACLVKVFSDMGVKNIVVIDIFKGILGRIKKLGANFAINTKVLFPPVGIMDEIVTHCQQGHKTDIVLDSVQSWATAKLAAQIVKLRGVIVLFDQASTPLSEFNYIRYLDETNKQPNIIELNSYGNEFKNAIHFLKKNQDLCQFIPPYEVSLERAVEGLTIARSKLASRPCVIINCGHQPPH